MKKVGRDNKHVATSLSRDKRNREETIESSWGLVPIGSSMFKLLQELKRCRQRLKNWSKDEFGNNKEKLEALQEQLSTIQSNMPSIEGMQNQRQIIKEVEIFLIARRCSIIKDPELNG